MASVWATHSKSAPESCPLHPCPSQLPLEPSTLSSLFSSLGAPSHHPYCLATSLAPQEPLPSHQLLSSPRDSQRECQQLLWHTPASGRSLRVLRHRRQANRVGTQPQAHGCRRRKGSALGDPALPVTNQETEAGDQAASFEVV